MSETTKNSDGFVGYEYKEVPATQESFSFLLDGYENFGWCADENHPLPAAGKAVALHLKRNRRIVNKVELTRLQRQFEACCRELTALQKAKTGSAAAWALAAGLAGTAFIAGSVFAFTAAVPQVALCVVLAVPGFAGWIAPYFLYRALVRKNTLRIEPLLEEKMEELSATCEKGNSLLHK